MKATKITKKSMIILVCIIFLLVATVIITSIIVKKVNNPYGIKVVNLPLPMKYEYYNIKDFHFNKYIESADEFNNIFDKRYVELSEEQKKNYKSDKMIFRKYDDNFFKENFVYVLKTGSLYYGGANYAPRFIAEKCFYSEKKERLIIEGKVIDEVESLIGPTVVGVPITDWRGYIIEFPRSVFEEYGLTYDDIQIVYTNMKLGAENSQLGLDKYFNDPDYPRLK